MRLNDPEIVAAEYATEQGLFARRSVYRDVEGPDARELLFTTIAETRPRRVLEVGGGPGELAERIVLELDCDLAFIDISPRMVELARARGLDAEVGDVQALRFDDSTFDCAVAAWMLYHVPDIDRALAELARVLRPGGRLIAVSNSEQHLSEVRALAGVDMTGAVAFSRENGEESLRRHFSHLERRDVDGWVTFPDREAVRAYVRSMVTMRDRADLVPAFDGPVRAGARVTIFVATK